MAPNWKVLSLEERRQVTAAAVEGKKQKRARADAAGNSVAQVTTVVEPEQINKDMLVEIDKLRK